MPEYQVITAAVPRGGRLHLREHYTRQDRWYHRALCGSEPLMGWTRPWRPWGSYVTVCPRCIAVVVQRLHA